MDTLPRPLIALTLQYIIDDPDVVEEYIRHYLHDGDILEKYMSLVLRDTFNLQSIPNARETLTQLKLIWSLHTEWFEWRAILQNGECRRFLSNPVPDPWFYVHQNPDTATRVCVHDPIEQKALFMDMRKHGMKLSCLRFGMFGPVDNTRCIYHLHNIDPPDWFLNKFKGHILEKNSTYDVCHWCVVV